LEGRWCRNLPARSLGIGFVVGLAAHVGGFLLKTSATAEPLLLVGDLLLLRVARRFIAGYRRPANAQDYAVRFGFP
jgi:hypothetical protein